MAGSSGRQDPLSELARLIGQDDAVAASARNGGSRRPRDTDDHHELSAVPPRLNRTNPPEGERDEDPHALSDRRGRYDDAHARQPGYLAEPPAAETEEGDGYDPRGGNGGAHEGYEDGGGYRRGAPGDRGGPYGNGEDAEGYAAAPYDERYDEDPEAGGGYEDDAYYTNDGRMAPHGEDLYEEVPPRRRRSRRYLLAGVLGIAVVGTAAAYGYRAWTSGGDSDAPPVIKASTEPAKVMATNQGSDSQPSKQIYDRLDKGPGQSEQVVPREEEPLPTRSLSGDGLVNPGTSTGSLGGAPSGGPVASPPLLSGGTPTSDGEPKKVRTIAIRPDSAAGATDSSAAAVPPSPPAPDTAPAPVPAAAPPAPAPTKSRTSRAKPIAAAAAEPAPPAPDTEASAPAGPAAHSPLALGPAAPSGQRRVAAAPSASPAADGTAHYVVQVSSQRSEADAQASYKALQQKYASILGGHDPIIRRADLGDKGTFYRAQVGPFATMDEASQLCSSLKSAGGQCIVQRN